MILLRLVCIGAVLLLAGCGGPQPDQMRTVKSYEFSSCDSSPTVDANERAALAEFRLQVMNRYFMRDRAALFVANHESTSGDSGLREYEGPFYFYVHPRPVDPKEAKRGIEWVSTVYVHAARVRSRPNGAEWSEWERVRTRNFADPGRTADGLGRWKCLMNAEIAWADVQLRDGQWEVLHAAVSVYQGDELIRALPLPTREHIEGTVAVTPVVLDNAS